MNKIMENKVFGRKPSYQYLRSYIKEYNNHEHAGYVNHITSLVYYAIKHDFTEEQAKEYFIKQMNNCEKLLKHHSYGIYFRIPYDIVKDLFNVDMNDFKLEQYKGFAYNWNTRKYDENNLQVHHNYKYNCPNDLPKKIFRDYNEHVVYLYDLMEKHGYCNHVISFDKNYDSKNECDTLYVKFHENYNAAGNNCSEIRLKKYKEDYAKICLDFWHFIKLFDFSENPNNIDINDYYRRFENPDKVYDNTVWQMKHIHPELKEKEVQHKNICFAKPKTYRWNPILKTIEEVKEKLKSLLK